MTDMTVEDFARSVASIESAIGSRIIGQESVVRQVVIGLLSEGHVLLEGVPGLGKTELLKALSEAVDLTFGRLQFTPDLMPADIVGTQVLSEDEQGRRRFEYQKGPVFAHLVLADEINRATPKSQSALLEAMQERTVTVAGETRRLPRPFMVMATQNPIELEGTYPLPEAQLDRFLLKVSVGSPDAALLSKILTHTSEPVRAEVPSVLDRDQLTDMIAFANTVPVAPHLIDYVAALVSNTLPLARHGATEADVASRPEAVRRYVRHGSSPRGAQAIVRMARVAALIAGRPNVSIEDIIWVLVPALGHRLVLNYEAAADGVTSEQILADVLNQTSQPGMEVRGISA